VDANWGAFTLNFMMDGFGLSPIISQHQSLNLKHFIRIRFRTKNQQ
jgi:hypothetical protein